MNILCICCQKETNYPLYLQCDHIICIKCGDQLRRTDIQGSVFEEKYQIQCPSCSKTTRTNDILKLLNTKQKVKNQIETNDIYDLNLDFEKNSNQSNQDYCKSTIKNTQSNELQHENLSWQSKRMLIQQQEPVIIDNNQSSERNYEQKQQIDQQQQPKLFYYESPATENQYGNNLLQNNQIEEKIANNHIKDPLRDQYINIKQTIQDQKLFQQQLLKNSKDIQLQKYHLDTNKKQQNIQKNENQSKSLQNNTKLYLNNEKQLYLNNKSSQENILNQNQDISFNLKFPIKCKFHDDFITLFCCQCKTINCVSCIYNCEQNQDNSQLIQNDFSEQYHQGHQLMPIKQALAIIQQENQQFKQEIESKLLTIDQSIGVCKSNKNLLDIGYYNIFEKISQEFQEVIQQVKQKEIEMKNKINLQFQEKINDFNKYIKDLTYLKETMTHYRKQDFQLNASGKKSFQKQNDDNNKYNETSQNSILYTYSVYQILKNTLKNIDFNFKRYELTDINVVNFDKTEKQVLLNQISEYDIQ